MRIRYRNFPKPEPFERRKRIIFAALPHWTEEGFIVWLESVTVEEFWGPLTNSWRKDKFFSID